MRPIDAGPSEGKVKLRSAFHGEGAYEAFKRIASEFYTNHTYKFVALTLDEEPRPDIVTFTAEFWSVPSEAAAPPPNDPLTLSALEAVRAERQRQDALWGDQSGNSLFEWMSILGEEYGELCEAVNETCCKNPAHPDRGGYENIIKEAAQVAAVALEIIEAAYRRKPEDTDEK